MQFPETYAGLRVLDLSENIAGPLAAMVLADLGADVIKVERPDGEATRSLPPRWGGESTVFLAMNRNKRSVALDLRSAAGRDAVLTLVRTCDVVIESFRPGAADRLGLGTAALTAERTDLVHCSVNAFGTGPLGYARPGYDALIQAFTGIMSMTGEADGGPSRAAPSIIDVSTGMWAAMSIMAALVRRASSPGPQLLEAALVDSGLFLMAHQAIGYLATGTFPGRLGSAAPSASPYQCFPTADEPILIATSTDRTYLVLCEALELPTLAADPRFGTVPDRVEHREALAKALTDRLVTAPAEHWLEVLLEAGVPAGPVQDLGAALSHPLTRERAMVAPSEAGHVQGLQQLHLPMDRQREAPRRPPPRVGEHTRDVLRELGMDDRRIAQVLGADDAISARQGRGFT